MTVTAKLPIFTNANHAAAAESERAWSNEKDTDRCRGNRHLTSEAVMRLADIMTTKIVRTHQPVRVACSKCRGLGTKDEKPCPKCEGKRYLVVRVPIDKQVKDD